MITYTYYINHRTNTIISSDWIQYLSTKSDHLCTIIISSCNNVKYVDKSNIISIIFSNSVISIGESAFSNCQNLKSITFSKNLQSIDEFAFYNCQSLTFIIFPDNLKNVANNAFEKSGLKSIYIPKLCNINTFANLPDLCIIYTDHNKINLKNTTVYVTTFKYNLLTNKYILNRIYNNLINLF